MIGKILGNRYQVVEKIGDGGTAFVFKGMDNLLNRHVTVKILRPEYVSDQDFVRRFRREAQAAASLSHPNIVSIYDVGIEDGIHYIVMEYIHGQSLKELIEEMGSLPVAMAADYACQIAHALGNAHKHGIIHRDVKPHNILISEDGRVKVADFGIAQAVTASTVTYNNGSILGSVHYFAPEQARGGQTNEQSDIYSLGVVLFEMLTGQVPFTGESPVSIAVKHLQEPFPRPREINPEIPAAVERIIRRAVEKDPANRYRTAREISSDLSDYLQGKEVKAVLDEPFSTPGPGRKAGKPAPSGKRKMMGWQWAAAVAALLMVALLVVGVLRLRNYWVVPEVEVPDVVGESLASAADLLDAVNLSFRLEQTTHDTVPSGHVISQNPPAGRRVKIDRVIDLVVSTGPELVEVINVVGRMEREATLALKELGFEVEVQERHSDEPPGMVIGQNPGVGHRISRGLVVTLHVSIGGKPFPLRDLTGMTLDDVRNWLELFGLEPGRVREVHDENFAAGQVISQSPAANTQVQAGDSVDLTVSKGPDQTTVQKHEIRIDTTGIPEGQEVTVVIRDVFGERREKYTVDDDHEPIVTFGWGSGEVEVRWRGNSQTTVFPQE
jgi:eukaryotic-like serine/threonine-protein kinase